MPTETCWRGIGKTLVLRPTDGRVNQCTMQKQNPRETALRFSKCDKELLKVFSRVHGIWWKQQIFSSVALAACMWRAGMLRARANWRSRTIPWTPLMKPDSRKRRRRGCTGPGRECKKSPNFSKRLQDIWCVCCRLLGYYEYIYLQFWFVGGGVVCLFFYIFACFLFLMVEKGSVVISCGSWPLEFCITMYIHNPKEIR